MHITGNERTYRKLELSCAIEKVGGGIEVCVTDAHTFGTDSFLLSYFAEPKKWETACDLGSGCGIVPLLWFRDNQAAPQKAFAVDVQEQAVQQARLSVERSNLQGRLEVVQADLRQLKKLPGQETVDLVTCNPPYKAWGTGLVSALDSARVARHETMCTLEDVCACGARLLRFGGRFCICQLPERLVDVLETMRRNKVEPKRIRFVQQTVGSAPWLFLVEGKRGTKPFLTIEPPLILKENGAISKEMQQVYSSYGRV